MKTEDRVMAEEVIPMIDSILLSEYVLTSVGRMSHLKLQKLLYYIQALHLAYYGEPLIEDEFQAWLHGPVSRKVWDKYKSFSVLLNDLDIGMLEARKVKKQTRKILGKDQLELIDDVLKEYGDKTDYHLERLTHSEGPWMEARKGVGISEASENTISRQKMKEYYRKLIYEPK